MGKWATKAQTPRATCQPLPPGKRSWHEEVEERLAKKAEREAHEGPESRLGKCTAHTSGKYGPKRPCGRWALLGAPVCQVHGATKLLREKAEQLILEETIPSIKRLRHLRDQDEDLKVSLGASVHLITRAMGEAGKGKGQSAPAHTVIVGVNIGGLPGNHSVAIKALPSAQETEDTPDPMEDDAIEGEVVDARDEEGPDPMDGER